MDKRIVAGFPAVLAVALSLATAIAAKADSVQAISETALCFQNVSGSTSFGASAVCDNNNQASAALGGSLLKVSTAVGAATGDGESANASSFASASFDDEAEVFNAESGGGTLEIFGSYSVCCALPVVLVCGSFPDCAPNSYTETEIQLLGNEEQFVNGFDLYSGGPVSGVGGFVVIEPFTNSTPATIGWTASGMSVCALGYPDTQCSAGSSIQVVTDYAEVFDSSGNLEPNAVVMTDSGVIPSPAPEPGTFPLLASVLVTSAIFKRFYLKTRITSGKNS